MLYAAKKVYPKKNKENSHISEEEKRFLKTGEGSVETECPKCPRKLLNQKCLEIHTQKVHISNEIRCRLGCSAVFYRRKKYLKHLKLVHKSNSLKSGTRLKKGKECNLCYKKMKELNRHKEVMHAAEKEFLEREITEEDLKYDCTKCTYKFVSQAILNNHMKQHDYGDKTNPLKSGIRLKRGKE